MIISWNTTRACNIKCIHCYRSAGEKQQDELNTEEGKKLITGIAQAGFKILILSGGEPLLRADLTELIRHARSAGLRPVLGTNGILITRELAASLKEAGLAAAGISIDSLNSAEHDAFRGCSGAWEQTLAGIEACKTAGLPFQIHTTVSSWNQNEILAITDRAVAIGAVAHHIFFLVPTGRGKDIEGMTLKAAEYEALLGAILDKHNRVKIEIKPTCAPQFMRIAAQRGMKLRYTKGCLAGTSYCVILPNGDVHPCPYLPLSAGNVRETDFETLWRESGLFNDLRHQPLKGGCGSCGFDSICGGCRARAYYYSDGDYLAEEPWCGYGR
jgi:putative heme d1 biosynthesis radical SAM protein NirJ2